MEEIQALINTIWVRNVLASLIAFLVIAIGTHMLIHLMYQRITEASQYYKMRKGIIFAAGLLYIVILIVIWVEVAQPATTYIGLLSAGIALALREIFSNLAAWLFIIIRKPFAVGDRIKINQQEGDVIDIRSFQFSLIEVYSEEDGGQSTGRIIDIPNNYIFLYPVINAVKGFEYIWDEIKVELTLNSNWKLAKETLSTIVWQETEVFSKAAENSVKEATKWYMIVYNNYTPIVYTDVQAGSIVLSMRYLVSTKQRRIVKNNIWEAVLLVLQEQDEFNLAINVNR